jgi:response regulator NasT
MGADRRENLMVLVANEREDRLELAERVITALGHTVVARESDIEAVAATTAASRPDVALVALGGQPDRALRLITEIVHQAACPVIAILEVADPRFVNEAAKRGIFAYIIDDDPASLQSALDIVLRRFSEFQNLEGAFGRRAITERAKGILMERHGIDEHAAFDMLRTQSQRSGRKMTEVAEAVATSHLLLREQPQQPTQEPKQAT